MPNWVVYVVVGPVLFFVGWPLVVLRGIPFLVEFFFTFFDKADEHEQEE